MKLKSFLTLITVYCSEVWGYMGKGLCDRLQRWQIYILHLGWDALEQRRSKQLGISVFKSLDNLYHEPRML